MNLAAEYRDGDYDIDKHFDKTTSWPDGLHEVYRFVPNLPRAVRRINSVDDIERYKDYFTLARKNQGKFFTWKHYLKILRDDLRHFDTLLIISKAFLNHLASPVNSEVSSYVTASECDISKKIMAEPTKLKKRTFLRREIGDAESISSVDDVSINSAISSLTPHKNLLKKMCTEIRTLARKTCKTVEKMSTKTKYCSACGDYIGTVKVHKKCSQLFVEGTDVKKPITPSMLKITNLARTRSMSFDSLIKTPNPSGESASPQTNKLAYTPDLACRIKPIYKRSPKEN